MRTIAIAVVLLSLGTAPVLAGMTEGKAALDAGDYATAINELKPLAETGDASAQALLAQIYLGGHGGSAAEAMTLLNAAANQGDAQAQAQLGLIYATGKGAPADNMKAYQWFALAAKSQQAATPRILAETNRDAIGRRLSASERAQAETLIASWQPSASQTFASASAVTPATPAVEPAPVAAAPVATPVEVASTTPDPAAMETAAGGDSPAGIRIQLASVPGQDQATREWQRLQHKYSSALGNLALTVEAADLGTKGVYHRVQAGPFADKASAKAKCAELQAAGAACMVVVR